MHCGWTHSKSNGRVCSTHQVTHVELVLGADASPEEPGDTTALSTETRSGRHVRWKALDKIRGGPLGFAHRIQAKMTVLSGRPILSSPRTCCTTLFFRMKYRMR